ncbi:MAG: SDR family NAD(P)-dependent oxidoreductase [Solirubrobacteraceae bacterium]
MADEGRGGRVWLITGASRGLGRAFAQAALDEGDAVALAARDPSAVEDLCAAHPDSTLALDLDVTDRAAAHRAVAGALDAFGRIDVLVNSAGHGLHAAVEETTESEAREQMETNFFGALWVTQAVMGVMRRQRSGRILQVSSAAGGTGFPMVGLYCASKFALEGMTEALALEAERFGIAVTIVAPSDFRTGFLASCRDREAPIDEYSREFADNLEAMSVRHVGSEPGDPLLAARAVLDLVRDPHPPRKLLLGNRSYDVHVAHHRAQLAEWVEQEGVARSADG